MYKPQPPHLKVESISISSTRLELGLSRINLFRQTSFSLSPHPSSAISTASLSTPPDLLRFLLYRCLLQSHSRLRSYRVSLYSSAIVHKSPGLLHSCASLRLDSSASSPIPIPNSLPLHTSANSSWLASKNGQNRRSLLPAAPEPTAFHYPMVCLSDVQA